MESIDTLVSWVQNIVQSVHQKCLELHNFVPIFLIFFLGEDPRPPSFTCIV